MAACISNPSAVEGTGDLSPGGDNSKASYEMNLFAYFPDRVLIAT